MSAPKKSAYPNISDDSEKCLRFLSQFIDDYTAAAASGAGPEGGAKKYMKQLQQIADRESNVLNIELDDIKAFGDEEFRYNILSNTKRYETLFYAAADSLMPAPSRDLSHAEMTPEEVYYRQRKERLESALGKQRAEAAGAGGSGSGSTAAAQVTPQEMASMFPPELLRRYEIHFIPASNTKPTQLRQIRAKDVGSFVSVRGIVTRITDVAPQVRVVTYICHLCGYESYQPVNDKTYTPIQTCPSPICTKNQQKGKLILQTKGSKFVRYQSVRLQELHTEVPVGHIPRTTTVRVFGSLTRGMKPGDMVTISGVFLVSPYAGFRAIRAGLTTDTYIEASHVAVSKKSYAQQVQEIDPKVEEEIEERSKDPNVFQQLAASIAPEIYGHQDIKKALMLLLVGGVTRSLSDGMKIRGDINVLLMGDPGVAKSQLLKHIAHIAPRGIYTTGKGSSGVGLTAAVLRDPTTGDMSLEGGSLVLADMGICCIDEFDKMDEGDRTAIHEVMEQQTVSIAKAGITTTLNARAAVLAAANPVWGRWRPKMSPEANLGLPASLLSRFDLTWIILDRADNDSDTALARHVTHVHIHNQHPTTGHAGAGVGPLFDAAFLRAYIAKARTFTPYVPRELTEYIVSSYVALRKEGEQEADGLGFHSSTSNTRQRFCTARMLLSILRLSQALARLHFRQQVERDDVEEAMRLVEGSKMSHLADDGDKVMRSPEDIQSAIYQLICSMQRESGESFVNKAEAQTKVMKKGFAVDDFENALREYEELGVWIAAGRKIQFLNGGRA